MTHQKLVLIVDDDTNLIGLLKHLVEREGLRVETAQDGYDAVNKAKQLKPDAIFLDYMLPGPGGYEVVRELQAAGLGHIPVVVMTSHRFDPGIVEMFRKEPNVKDYLEKPVAVGTFLSAVGRALGARPRDP